MTYGYDAVAPSGCTPPTEADTYPIGRRTAMCDGSGASSWKHDQMGRMLQERRRIGAAKGEYDTDAYNLDGSPHKAIQGQKNRYGFSNLEEQRANQRKRHGGAKE